MPNQTVLLVEGQDDKHIVTNLLFAHDLNNEFDVKDKDGIENLLASLPVELRASDRDRLGVIVDADTPLVGRWERASAVLRRSGYAPPKTPDPLGTIIYAAEKPILGLWLMPNNRVDGMIEDFAALLVPTADPLLPRARSVVDEIPLDQRKFAQVHLSKAVMHTWLAWQEEPGVRAGAAITRRYLQHDSPTAGTFIAWLRRLLAARPGEGATE